MPNNIYCLYRIPGGGLLVTLADESTNMVSNMQRLGLSPVPLYQSLVAGKQIIEPINLYHKVGHGTLDLYVLTPSQDSADVKSVVSNWSKKLDAYSRDVPAMNALAVACVLVWVPASKTAPVTRVLFTGEASQSKILEGVDKLKSVQIFQTASGLPEKKISAAKQSGLLPSKPAPSRNNDGAPARVPASPKPAAATAGPTAAKKSAAAINRGQSPVRSQSAQAAVITARDSKASRNTDAAKGTKQPTAAAAVKDDTAAAKKTAASAAASNKDVRKPGKDVKAAASVGSVTAADAAVKNKANTTATKTTRGHYLFIDF